MAKETSKIQVPEMTATGIVWDTESRYELADQQGRVRDNNMFFTASLTSVMEKKWGGVLAFVKTSTSVETGEVTIAKANKNDEGAVQVRRYGTQNAVVFNFWRPLRKLGLKVPADRQFNVTPFTKELPGVGTVFVFPMNDRVSVPRNLKEEQAEGQATDGAKTETAAKSAKAQAAPAPQPAPAPTQPAPAPVAEVAAAKEPAGNEPETPKS